MSRENVLVSADWVEQHLDDPQVVLVEVDEDTTAYDKNHIKNAARLDWKSDLQDPVRRDFVNKEQFEALLSAKGIGNDDTVVLYGGNNNWFAAYAYWYFKLYGHDDVRLLDGGRKIWELESRELVDDLTERTPTEYRASDPDLAIRAFRDEVVGAIGTKNLVDVRSPDEYAGRLLAPAHLPQEQAQRGGHIRPRRTSRGARRPTTTERSAPTTTCARSTARRVSTSTPTPSPTAASASVRHTPGSCCMSCSACPTSRTTTGPGPNTGRWSACRSRWATSGCGMTAGCQAPAGVSRWTGSTWPRSR